MSKTIDVTPTWSGVVPWITAGLEAGGTAHSSALQEMYRMADAADKWNASAPDLLAALSDIVASSDANCGDSLANAIETARAAIAKAKGEQD